MKMEGKLAEIFEVLDTDQEELPELVQYANDLTNPEGDQVKLVKNVRNAEQLLESIIELKVTNSI
jgi:hypothetical protein